MPEDVKVLLDVWISVCIILPAVVSREMCFRRLVQARGQAVCTGFSDGCKAAPASGIQPLLTIAGGIDVNGDKNYLAGVDLYDIMKVTGHASPKMLKKYIKADSLEVVEKLTDKYEYFR